MTGRERRRINGLQRLAGECCRYGGNNPAKRRTLLPRVLRTLGYDIGHYLHQGEMRLMAKAPGDTEFFSAPEILDDLRSIADLTPWPFELVGTDRYSWSARVQARGGFVHGRFPASTLTAALLLWSNPQRSGIDLPPLGAAVEAFPFPLDQ